MRSKKCSPFLFQTFDWCLNLCISILLRIVYTLQRTYIYLYMCLICIRTPFVSHSQFYLLICGWKMWNKVIYKMELIRFYYEYTHYLVCSVCDVRVCFYYSIYWWFILTHAPRLYVEHFTNQNIDFKFCTFTHTNWLLNYYQLTLINIVWA